MTSGKSRVVISSRTDTPIAAPRQKVDLVQEVVSLLEEQIISGKLEAEKPIPPEGELCRQLGVSRTVVREAMRILGARGLVEVSQGKLPRVKAADPSLVVDSLATFLQRSSPSLFHLIEVRRHLETLLARLAASRATAEQVDAMQETIRLLPKADTLEGQIAQDLRFHSLLADSAQNPIFGILLEPLSHLMRISRTATLSRTGAERACADHQKILDAIRLADPEAAANAMLQHLDRAEQDLNVSAEPDTNK
jgi:DNA-binding FadR family transcriptional regulator